MSMGNFVFRAIDIMFGLVMNPKHLKNVSCDKHDNYDFFYTTDPTDKPKPIIINLHGGGFMAGDKKYRRYWSEILANDGWFVINANYRLCPNVTIIEQIKDAWNVVCQTPTIATTHNLDASTVVITGDSSGAYLAAYMIALSTNPDLCQRLGITQNSQIQFSGALLYCGVYDLPYMLESQKGSHFYKSMAQDLTGKKFKTFDEIKTYVHYQDLSIQRFINDKWCPIQMFYSEKDFFVKGQGELFYQALKERKVPVQQHHTTKLADNHCYHLFFLTKMSKKSLEISKQFLDKIRAKS